MDPQLTSGIVPKALDQSQDIEDILKKKSVVVQVLETEVISSEDKKYRLCLSDGVHRTSTVLFRPTQDTGSQDPPSENSIVEIGFQRSYIQTLKGQTAWFIESYRLLSSPKDVIGAPVTYTASPSPSQATPSSTPVSSTSFKRSALLPPETPSKRPRTDNDDNDHHHHHQTGDAAKRKLSFESISRSTHEIKSLNPNTNKYKILCRVISKGTLRKWSNSNGEGHVFNVVLQDASGEIRATGFNQTAERLFPLFEEGRDYYVSDAQIKPVQDRRYNSTNHNYEMGLKEHSLVVPADESSSSLHLPQLSLSLTKLSDIGGMSVQDTLDVMGVVALGEAKEISMADPFNDSRAPTGVREDEGTSMSNTLEFGGRIPDSLAASQEVQDQSGEANLGSDIDACSSGGSHSSEDSGDESSEREPNLSSLLVTLITKQNENSLKMMKGMLQRFLGKTLGSGSSGNYDVPVSTVLPENESAPIESFRELKKVSDPSTSSVEPVVQPLEPPRGKYSPEQCPIIGAGPREKQEWALEMSSYEEKLTTALAGLPSKDVKVRKEKNLRYAAEGMAAYLKAKEDGPGIVREVLGMTDKIRRNPTLADDIKAGEVELIRDLKSSISALNARWAVICMESSVLQELKDALQALSIAGKTPSSTAAREINVLNYVSPFSGEEESTRATFERWRRDWDVCHNAIIAAGATEADAYHRLLAAMSPGSPAHSLVLRHQRSPSQCYSLAMRALEEAYGDLVRMATDLVGPAPLSRRPSEVVQDLKDFLGMKETLLKAGVDIADVLAQQKVLAMLPPSYNAAEAWPKWVESALWDQAIVAAAASRSQVVGPTGPDPGIGALYKMEGLQLFALWLEEKHPPLEQEAAVFHATSEKENKEAKVIPPPPRAFKNSIFSGCLCGSKNHRATTCDIVAGWSHKMFFEVTSRAKACRACGLHVFQKGEKCRHKCRTCGLGHPTNRHSHHQKREDRSSKRQGSGRGEPLPKKFKKEGEKREKDENRRDSKKATEIPKATVDAAELVKALKSFFKGKESED